MFARNFASTCLISGSRPAAPKRRESNASRGWVLPRRVHVVGDDHDEKSCNWRKHDSSRRQPIGIRTKLLSCASACTESNAVDDKTVVVVVSRRPTVIVRTSRKLIIFKHFSRQQWATGRGRGNAENAAAKWRPWIGTVGGVVVVRRRPADRYVTTDFAVVLPYFIRSTRPRRADLRCVEDTRLARQLARPERRTSYTVFLFIFFSTPRPVVVVAHNPRAITASFNRRLTHHRRRNPPVNAQQ